MKITQGTFSYLSDLSDEQIVQQIDYCLGRSFALNIEFTDEPHPRNTYWEMWNMPIFDNATSEAVMKEVHACRIAHPNHYIKLNAFNSTRGVESIALSIIVNRPPKEPGFRLTRQETDGRNTRYTLESYASDRPEGKRY